MQVFASIFKADFRQFDENKKAMQPRLAMHYLLSTFLASNYTILSCHLAPQQDTTV